LRRQGITNQFGWRVAFGSGFGVEATISSPFGKSNHLTRLVTLALLLTTAISAAVVSGSVTGMVVDDTGKPVVRARVFIQAGFPPGLAKQPAGPPVLTGPNVVTTMSDNKGAFSVGHLLTGHYVACAHPATQGLLNPCHWSATAPEFTIVAGKPAPAVKITLTKGAVLPIHVDDPQQLLAPVKGIMAGDLQFHIVTAKGTHHLAYIVATNKTSRDHSITVPFGTPVTVQVYSPHLVVNDSTGKPAAAAGISVGVPTAASPATLTYTVTGTK
jgi:hypothetical protein